MIVASGLAIGLSVLLLDGPPADDKEPAAPCTWLAGDVGAHTAYSFVSARKTSLEEALLYALSVQEQADLASGRGLDFLAITDYNDVSSQSDAAFGSDGLIWVPGYEHPFAGVAQLLGVSDLIPVGAVSTREVQRVAQQLRDAGGVFQIGHPGDARWARAYGTEIAPDAVEVWFSGPWSYDPGKIRKDQTTAIRFFDRLLDTGHEVAATGGSNSLFRGITKLAGVGQPTTWVCAEEATTDGVLEAIAAGRTTLTHEYPTQGPLTDGENAPKAASPEPQIGDGSFTIPPPETEIPFVTLEADADGDGHFESTIGDTVPPGARLRIGVFGGPFSVLRVISDGSTVLEQADVFAPSFVHELEAPRGSTWLRVELFARPEDTAGGNCDVSGPTAKYCDDRIGMLALTSPVFVRAESTESPSPSRVSP